MKSHRALLLASLTALVLWPNSIEAAAPWLLMFHGDLLGKQIVISSWDETFKLLPNFRYAVTIDEGSLQSRPYIEMAYFWGQGLGTLCGRWKFTGHSTP